MTKTIFSEALSGRSLWIGLFPDDGMLDPDAPHCTLVFIGKVDEQGAEIALRAVSYLTMLTGTYFRAPLTARVGGVARFASRDPEGDPVVHLLQQPLLRVMRSQLQERLALFGHKGRRDDFDYTPHVTLGRLPRSCGPYHALAERLLLDDLLIAGSPPYILTRVAVCCGDVMLPFPMTGD